MKLERITELLGTALAAMDATPYQQGITESWRESQDPAGEIQGESAHLTYSVLCKGSPVTSQRRDTVGEVCRCASAIDVLFAFHVRVDQQLEDMRLAKRAAREIMALVNAETVWADVEGGDVVVKCRERFSPLYLLAQEPYVLVTVGFTIDHDEEI